MWRVYKSADTAAVEEMARFVEDHGKGHFMQLPCWASVKKAWHWRGVCLYRKERLIATASVLIRPLPLGYSLFYIPRGPVCDRNDPALWKEMMMALKRLAKQHRALVMYMDPDEPDQNTAFRTVMKKLGFQERSDKGFGNIQPQYVFRLPLKGRQETEIFRNFSPKTRYNTRLAERKGIVCTEYPGSAGVPDAALEAFCRLMDTTGQRDRFCVRDLPYFKGLMDALGDNARLLLAYLDGEPIAGAIQVFCGRKSWYLYGASSNEHREAMPNYLLQWTMIRRALERGCEMYDFRGVPGEVPKEDPLYGLYRFKKGFRGDYTKFTGLFTYVFHPVFGRLLELAVRARAACR